MPPLTIDQQIALEMLRGRRAANLITLGVLHEAGSKESLILEFALKMIISDNELVEALENRIDELEADLAGRDSLPTDGAARAGGGEAAGTAAGLAGNEGHGAGAD